MTKTTSTPHGLGGRVRCIFDGREGVVIESTPRATLIEFEEEEDGERFTHRKWLPTAHWVPTTGDNPAPGLTKTHTNKGNQP